MYTHLKKRTDCASRLPQRHDLYFRVVIVYVMCKARVFTER